MNSICFNGKIIPENEPVLLASNRGYRYGDGLFETMKVVDGKILFFQDHMQRLFAGLFDLLYEPKPAITAQGLEEQIIKLCRKNNCQKLARVRLSVSRGFGGLYDDDQKLQYIIESWPLNDAVNGLNSNGLVIDVSPGPQKNCDPFANIKSANFLPYSWAAIYAKQNKLNDCLVLNTRGLIADATIANCFITKNGLISTPSLNQGCVRGIMRGHLIEQLKKNGYKVEETEISVEQLMDADEVFLSNVINGMRWVATCRDKHYANTMTSEIYHRFIKTIVP